MSSLNVRVETILCKKCLITELGENSARPIATPETRGLPVQCAKTKVIWGSICFRIARRPNCFLKSRAHARAQSAKHKHTSSKSSVLRQAQSTKRKAQKAQSSKQLRTQNSAPQTAQPKSQSHSQSLPPTRCPQWESRVMCWCWC